MSAITKVGRILYAFPFAIFGIFHFIHGNDMAGIVPSWLPGGVFWVYLTGVALVAASVAIIIQRMVYKATIGLALLLLVFVLTVHLPGLGNPASMQMSMISLLKDLSLAGAALLIAGMRQPK